MTKARNLADLLDANGDVKSTNLDNVPASDNASALTTGTLPNARLPANISDSGTEGTKIATGTTAQRGSTQGQFRFNTTTGKFEGRNASGFTSIEPYPVVSSVNVTEVASDAGGNQTFVITGENFSSGDTVAFIGNDSSEFNATTTTVDSATQLTAVAPKASFVNSKEPYDIRVTKSTNLSSILNNQINVDNTPVWQTAAGSLGTINDTARSGVNIATSATDSDGDTVTYSLVSGALPAGLSLNSSTGAITGDATQVNSHTTSSFTLRATANSKTVDRAFTITVNALISGSTTYNYQGSMVEWTRPAGVSSVTIVMWGSGGATGDNNNGGHGGFSQGTLDVSNYSSLWVQVGQAGQDRANNFGGAYSAIFSANSISHANAIAVVGGGGGGSENGSYGGGGGGFNQSGQGGGVGRQGSQSGGGTLSGGGSTGNGAGGGHVGTSGGGFQGGNAPMSSSGSRAYNGGGKQTGSVQGTSGGAGGSGYYGGGGGTSWYATGGGGGSGYANTSVVSNINTDGSPTNRESTSNVNGDDNSEYSTNIGKAGEASGHGKVVIKYSI